MDSVKKEIIYDKEFIFVLRGIPLKRFFEYKICTLDGCDNQVNAFFFMSDGKQSLCSTKRHAAKAYCSKSCASKVNWMRNKPKPKSSYVPKKHIYPVDFIQKWLSPGISDNFNDYMVKV